MMVEAVGMYSAEAMNGKSAAQRERRESSQQYGSEELGLTAAELGRGDRALVARALDGDQGAYKDLYDGHVDRVFRLAYRMLADEEAAREATQKAFIRAFESLGQFRGDARFSTWLHRVAVSVFLNERRVAKRRAPRELEFDEVASTRSSAPPDVELGLGIRRAVQELAEIYRTVFVMHDVEGYKHEEIADVLGVAVGTSKARLSRARAMLRQTLGGDAQAAV